VQAKPFPQLRKAELERLLEHCNPNASLKETLLLGESLKNILPEVHIFIRNILLQNVTDNKTKMLLDKRRQKVFRQRQLLTRRDRKCSGTEN
jgi:hypothetical protein